MSSTNTTTMTYDIVYNRYTYSNHLERSRGDERVSPEGMAAEIAEKVQEILLFHREASGTITVTIEIEE